MDIKKAVLTCNIVAVIFFLVTLLGKDFFEYAPLVGWIGGFVSLTISLLLITIYNFGEKK
ncbi:hypothetical protein J7E73_27355 [Paenibacillus albidus]|uniref:hypothetical protein n=1 Tax=Paenibacillus albidus TaxID=2041023 RepID=UPI001BEBCC52|nr:hypothetical protein [Paenibacillus albidus]MBT2292783.1 hypothetical protein [Paenibacillus albidus]